MAFSFSDPAASIKASSPGDWIEALARFGYTAKGVVYSLIGVMAVQAAFGTGGKTEGSRGAIHTIAQQPFGRILLALMAVGLLGYVLWRFVQAIKDPHGKGTGPKALVQRGGYAVSGFTYLGLAFVALKIVLGGGDSGGGSQQTWTAKLLAQPAGAWIVGLVGLIIVGVGLYHFVRAYKANFMKHYKTGQMNAHERRWAERLGRFGLTARGVTFCIIGGFFIQAARQSDPSEAKGLDAALETLASQAYGPWLLGIVALGFVAYGIYCFSRARYRYFPTS